jgi:hypothetical protein
MALDATDAQCDVHDPSTSSWYLTRGLLLRVLRNEHNPMRAYAPKVTLESRSGGVLRYIPGALAQESRGASLKSRMRMAGSSASEWWRPPRYRHGALECHLRRSR